MILILFTIGKSKFMERNKMDKNTTMENLARALQDYTSGDPKAHTHLRTEPLQA